MPTVLCDAVLNRATMHRQLLRERDPRGALEAVHHLVGLQAQAANSPYLSLWSRLRAFTRDELTALMYARRVVRGGVLRGTQHLVTAADYPWLRAVLQPTADRARRAAFGRRTAGVDPAELAAVARDLLRGRTLTRPQLRDLLAERWPGCDAQALAWSVQALVAVVHPPPNGTWDRGGATPFALAEEWLAEEWLAGEWLAGERLAGERLAGERGLAGEQGPGALILRYLAAYGPAGVADVQTWSGVTRLREVMDGLPLRRYRDEAGRTLYDLPDAPLPDAGTRQPVRFLPEFDNLIVAYAHRGRLMCDECRARVCVGSMIHATVLRDGRVAGTWRMRRTPMEATLHVTPLHPLDDADRAAIVEEAARLLAFAAPAAASTAITVD